MSFYVVEYLCISKNGGGLKDEACNANYMCDFCACFFGGVCTAIRLSVRWK